MTESSPFTVLYIAGSGRSGSTLLEQLLGGLDGICPVGELRTLWWRGIEQDHRCGCGEPLSRCPFWQAVLEEAIGRTDRAAAREVSELARTVERARYMPALLAPSTLAPPGFERRLARYSELLSRLYGAIRHLSGAQVIVDNSKEPPYGLALRFMRDTRVVVVHLVRDSRAVAYSRQRVKVNPQVHWTEHYMKRYPASATALEWDRRNVLAEGMALAGIPYRRLRYEDLAADPKGERDRLLEWAVPGRAWRGAAPGTPQHTVSGNPMRFDQETRPVRVDREWETGMDARSRRAVWLLTLPLLARYGYLGRRATADESSMPAGRPAAS